MTIKKLWIVAILLNTWLGVNAQKTAEPDTNKMRVIELGEITVFASKNNQRYKEIPASISVITAKSLATNEIRTLGAISSTAPNFFMPQYGSKLTSPVYIRGIGSKINAPGVGLYVDNVPYFEKAVFAFDFFDVEQIEVLRGPQGTLFGRNTEGGIINIKTLSPFDYQGGKIGVSAGGYGMYSANLGYYGKVADKFGYSFGVNYQHNDGFFTNNYNGEKVDKLNSVGLRNRLIWKPIENLSFENIASYEKSKQGGYPYSIYNDTLRKATPINYNMYSEYNREMFSDAFIAKYKAKNFEVSSVTSYQGFSDHQGVDQDFSKESIYYAVQQQVQNMFSEELMAKSNWDKKYNWLVGFFAFDQKFNNEVDVDMFKTKSRTEKHYDHEIMGYAFFHQSTLRDFLIPNLTLTAGIRFDVERDKMHFISNSITAGVTKNLDNSNYQTPNSNEWLPKVALNYKLGKANIYTVVAKGYKTGGFNTSFVDKNKDMIFKPEYSWNYEIGVKSPLLNERVYADFDLFYINLTNQQISQPLTTGIGSQLTNAGRSESKGAEVSLKSFLGHGYELSVAYGYTHATFKDYVNDFVKKTNYNGKYVPMVPRNTLAAQATKTFMLKDNNYFERIRLNATFRGVGKIFWYENNSHEQPFYTLLDAKISFIGKNYQVDLWGHNLFNTRYEAYYFEMKSGAATNKYVQLGHPRQLGVNLSVKF